MTTFQEYTTLAGLTANSTGLASSQFLFGKLSSTSVTKVIAPGTLNSTTNPGIILGVIMNKPAGNEEVEFAVSGIAKVIVATSTIIVGDRLWSNTTGKATDAGTTDNGFYVARALETAAAANDIIKVILSAPTGARY